MKEKREREQLAGDQELARKTEQSMGVLELGLPGLKGRYLQTPAGLMLPESAVERKVLEPDDLLNVSLGTEGGVLFKSLKKQGALSEFTDRLEAMAQELAVKEGYGYGKQSISRTVFEISYNAVKHGADFSGEPVWVSWKLGARESAFEVADSGKKDFDPLKYAKMTTEEYVEKGDFDKGGHAGITIVVGRLNPNDPQEGTIPPSDIKWIPVRNEKGERMGTRVVFKIRSEKN